MEGYDTFFRHLLFPHFFLPIVLFLPGCGAPSAAPRTTPATLPEDTFSALLPGTMFEFANVGHLPAASYCFFRDVPEPKLLVKEFSGEEDGGFKHTTVFVREADAEKPFILFFGADVPPGNWDALHAPTLRGIVIHKFSERLIRELSAINLDQVCVSLTGDAIGETLPRLPSGVRYLELRSSSATTIELSGRFPCLEMLRYLDVQGEVADLSFLSEARRMVALRLAGGGKRSAEVVRRDVHVDSLRFLSVEWRVGSGELIDFIRQFPNLEALDVDFGFGSEQEASLESISDLDRLERLRISNARLRLPATAWPALEVLSLVRAEVAAEGIAAFKASHPSAIVLTNWSEATAYEFAKVASIKVRVPGTEHESITVFETADPAEVIEFTSKLVASPEGGGFLACTASAAIDLRREGTPADDVVLWRAGSEETVVEAGGGIGVVDGAVLCLHGFSNGCVTLVPESRDWFGDWLAERRPGVQPTSGCSTGGARLD